MATSQKWIKATDNGSWGDKPIPHSGGEGKQLKGFDARTREIASPSGGTVTAKLLKRAGANIPAMKESKETPAGYKTPLSSKMGEPVAVKKWTKKYL